MKSISYGYTNTTWKDLLKTYDGATIIYDNSGNPTSYRGDTMQWSNNQLTQQTHNGSTITYTYNESGLRTKKNVSGGTQTTYVWKDGVLCAMQSGTKVLEFSYSANGDVVSVLMRNQGASSGTRYYYARNAQGDVIGLVNSSGTMVIRYTYDSWGKLISTTGTATIGTLNPFRYRGYIYDTETGLYYLKTRYYDPEVGRFINADVLMSTGQGVIGCNMFCYCLNNPVNMVDESGEFAITISATAVVSIVGIVALLLTADYAINREKSLIGILSVQITSLYTSISSIEFSTSVSDPFARPGQKKQDRERKEKKRKSKDWDDRSGKRRITPPKKHTPGKEHRKYNTLFGGEYECLD